MSCRDVYIPAPLMTCGPSRVAYLYVRLCPGLMYNPDSGHVGPDTAATPGAGRGVVVPAFSNMCHHLYRLWRSRGAVYLVRCIV